MLWITGDSDPATRDNPAPTPRVLQLGTQMLGAPPGVTDVLVDLDAVVAAHHRDELRSVRLVVRCVSHLAPC